MKEGRHMQDVFKMMQAFTNKSLEHKKSSKWKDLSTAPKDKGILLAIPYERNCLGYNYVVAQWCQIFEYGYWSLSGVNCHDIGDDAVRVNENTLWTDIPD